MFQNKQKSIREIMKYGINKINGIGSEYTLLVYGGLGFDTIYATHFFILAEIVIFSTPNLYKYLS